MSDFKTIKNTASSIHKVSGSRHLGFTFEVETEEQAKSIIQQFRDEHAKANHVCYAYRIGASMNIFRSSDDGEPSGTAGKPIFGQIQSFGLTNVLVIVVRYFGGIKLGTGGLIDAYKTAAFLALEASGFVFKKEMAVLRIEFSYTDKPEIMKLLKLFNYNKIGSELKDDDLESITFSMEAEKKEAFFRKLPRHISVVETS